MHRDARVGIVMGRVEGSDGMPTMKQQSMIIVPLPSPGVKILRPLDVFGYDDAPHGHGEVLLRPSEVSGGQHPFSLIIKYVISGDISQMTCVML